jgi:hypothetical protein
MDPAQWLLTRSERGNPSTVLDDQHQGDRAWSTGNPRPIPLPPLSPLTRAWARVPLNLVHDPDGRPRPLRGGTRS